MNHQGVQNTGQRRVRRGAKTLMLMISRLCRAEVLCTSYSMFYSFESTMPQTPTLC
jgi:hypothetical protein